MSSPSAPLSIHRVHSPPPITIPMLRKPLAELSLLPFLSASAPAPSSPKRRTSSPLKPRSLMTRGEVPIPAKRRMMDLMAGGVRTPKRAEPSLGNDQDEDEGQRNWESASPARRLFVDGPNTAAVRTPIVLNPSPLAFPTPVSPTVRTSSPTTVCPPTRSLAPSPPILDRASSSSSSAHSYNGPAPTIPTTPSRRSAPSPSPNASPSSTPRPGKKPRLAGGGKGKGKHDEEENWDELSDDEMLGIFSSSAGSSRGASRSASASGSRSGSVGGLGGWESGGDGNADPHACGFIIYSDPESPSSSRGAEFGSRVVVRGFEVGMGDMDEDQENVEPLKTEEPEKETPRPRATTNKTSAASAVTMNGFTSPKRLARPVLDPESPFVVTAARAEGDMEMSEGSEN